MLYPIELRALFPSQEPLLCRGDRSIHHPILKVKTNFHLFRIFCIFLRFRRIFPLVAESLFWQIGVLRGRKAIGARAFSPEDITDE